MSEQPQPMQRGPRLLIAHLKSLDPATLTAQQRLAIALGPQLAHKLLFALAPGRQRQSRRAA
ncbi:MAG: hypothetical protein ACRDLM_05355 [Gaiellaceae bacterium]